MSFHLQPLTLDRRGSVAVEYGLILALVFVAIVSGVAAVGDSTHGLWGRISAQVQLAG